MILMIDNYDSFTYNLVQYLLELGVKVEVVKNDAISLDEINALKPDKIVLSPGPGRPEDAGITLQLIQNFFEEIPILGVCLGHQCLAQAFGGKINQAKRIMHGKTSLVNHDNIGIFHGLPNGFQVMRYHSLTVAIDTLPKEFEMCAWVEYDSELEIMAIRHKQLPLYGVQFHPESILTEYGHALLKNFLEQ